MHPTGLVKPDDADAKIKFLAAEADGTDETGVKLRGDETSGGNGQDLLGGGGGPYTSKKRGAGALLEPMTSLVSLGSTPLDSPTLDHGGRVVSSC